MRRQYTDVEKQIVLERLVANNGDIPLTAQQTGVTERTLYRWRTLAGISPMSSLSLPPSPPFAPQIMQSLAKDDVQALMGLKHTLMEKVGILAESIEPAIAEAPLPQRITALIQLIDRIMRMSAELPKTDEDETVEIEVAHHVEKTQGMEQRHGEKDTHSVS